MAEWQRRLARAASNIEDQVDSLRFRLRQKFETIESVTIMPYFSYGTRTRFIVRGRVLGNHRVATATSTDNSFQNALNMVRRFDTHEIPHARIEVSYDGAAQTITADEEGFFESTITLTSPLQDEGGWHEVTLRVLDYADIAEPITGHILVPHTDAQFGVISDLDDTVLQSDVLKPLKLARNVFFKNAHTRLPFDGVAAFYQALQRGTGNGINPIYYVSNSPWNIYDLIVDFFRIRNIPRSPLFLVNLGLTEIHFLRPAGMTHKLGAIEKLFETYPALPFILIGDSGEHDAEIYLAALEKHPGRVLAIYIRDVTGQQDDTKINAIVEQAEALGVPMLLIPDTAAAAAHALENGYILPESAGDVVEEIAEN